jgi:ABC-type transport system substrate-binding protein
VIGAAANDPTSVAVANTAADQLRNAGVRASVLALDPPTLYGQAIPDGRVDAIVGWHQSGGDLATVLASRYGCPALQSSKLPETRTTTPPPPPASNTPAPPAREESVRAPSNLTGLCDEGLQASIDAALTGQADVGKVVDQAEPQLWKMATVLPIMQDTTIAAAGPSVQNVELTGAVPVGIVATAGEWKKTRP